MNPRVVAWVEWGHHYGYPGCCIAAFVVRAGRMMSGLPVEPAPDVLNGTGYVACHRCALKPAEQLIAEINARRMKCLKPFPIEGRAPWRSNS